MHYFIIFVILGIFLWIVLKKIKRVDKAELKAKQDALLPEHATLKNVAVGGVISLTGFTAEYQDLDFVVETVNRYERGGFEWFELIGSHGDKKLFLEWEIEDGEFFITATSSRKGFRLNKLGITEEDLVKMDENQSQENFIEFESEKNYYEQSGEVMFFENNRGSGEGFYAWNFINEEETKVITIEKWEDEPFEVFTGSVVDHSNIQICKVK